MKILIAGGGGRLGRELERQALMKGGEVISAARGILDITDPDMVSEAIRTAKPDVVINCAAYTRVDECECDVERSYRVNALGAGYLSRASRETGALIIHISTDYVFNGYGERDEIGRIRPYLESDNPDPLSVYGKTKLIGEQLVRRNNPRHCIVRTAWLYGDGRNFASALMERAAKGESLRVVNDRTGTPTSTFEAARAILMLAGLGCTGLFHATCEGACTWYEFSLEILRLARIKVPVTPCASSEYPCRAPRPAYSVLENRSLKHFTGMNLQHWRDALGYYMMNRK